MLTEQTFTKLRDMKLFGMATAYERMQADPGSAELSFEERFAMLVDSEHLDQQNRALTRRLIARFRDEGRLMPGIPKKRSRAGSATPLSRRVVRPRPDGMVLPGCAGWAAREDSGPAR